MARLLAFVLGSVLACETQEDASCRVEDLALATSFPSRLLQVEVFVLADDQGDEPLVSAPVALTQLGVLERYFSCAGLKFSLKYTTINSSFLWAREVLLSCPLQQVGDGLCQPHCNRSTTNYDGGDCLTNSSSSSSSSSSSFSLSSSFLSSVSWPSTEGCEVPSSECRERCNLAKFNWDHGRCCVEGVGSLHCRDPASALCRFVSPSAVKEKAPSSPSSKWNVYVARVAADCPGCEPSLSTPPWKTSLTDVTAQGSVLGHAAFMAPGSLLAVHELGHTLGLPDVFAGICPHPCAPKSVGELPECVEGPGLGEDCAGTSWTQHPNNNAMSHGHLFGPSCCTPAGAFSPRQCAVMRCHLERTQPAWTALGSSGALSEEGDDDDGEGSDEPAQEDASPWGPLGIVGAAIAVAILVGVCLGVYQAMKPEAKSRDESLSVVAPDTDNYTVM